MNRQPILDLYTWADGICFRHPGKGVVPTAVLGTLHPRAAGEAEVRGCAECVIELETAKRQCAASRGSEHRTDPEQHVAE
ncbi:hypothetical protein [Streptomyces albogriseolus]|uniref:hypothetical protein n=1 Tax=Streptomyces albogriseolus TaxID=1887 RepID=UPI0034614214